MAKQRKRRKIKSTAPELELLTRDAPNHRKLVWGALHYAQYELTDKQLKKNLVSYAKANELDYKLLNVFTDKELAVAGKYAYILAGGGELPDDMEIGFGRLLDELFVKAKRIKVERKKEAKKTKEKAGPVLTVQDRMRIQAEEVGATFDGWIDDVMFGKIKKITKEMDPTSVMTEAGFKAGQARWVKKFYQPELKEIKAVIAGKDADVKEGYKNIKKVSARRVEKLLENIITSAKMLETVAKAKRKTRRKKAPSVAKKIAKLKYCERHDETGVASVNPAGIIGAKEVWVYNTKYRKLGKFVAQDASGLSVKGTTVTDFDTVKSVQKTLRKPKEQLKDFMAAGKVKLRTYLDNIKAVDTKMKGRMNNNIVILKVFK